ncbi:MAG: tetratricopeptide repeat protein, partial [Anaerolineales bacterium]|nr:tetratricopeptide repeat protein [Anaerolineales bacterium]
MMKRFFYLLMFVGLLAACAGGDDPAPDMSLSAAVVPTVTLPATPTLVPALATLQPTITETTATAVSPLSDSGLKITAAKPTPTPTPTPSPTPTPTPQPAERVALGDIDLHNGDAETAVAELEAALRLRPSLSSAQIEEALYNLGVAYVRSEQPTLAANAFTELLGITSGTAPDAAYFYLGQAQFALGDYQAAIGAY